MKVFLRFTYFLTALLLSSTSLWAQPANDDCANSIEVPYSDSEETAVRVAGDTRGATASTVPTNVCSASFYTDDIWYHFTIPNDPQGAGGVIRVYFNNALNATDVTAIGMALYNSCGAAEAPLLCFSSSVPEDNQFVISDACLNPGQTYSLRVWSTGADASTEGTFEVAVFPIGDSETLWRESFAGGFEGSGWTTEGTCAVADSNGNAGFKFLADNTLDAGAYANVGVGVNGPSFCDGSMGVDSDYDDTRGVAGNFGQGPCPAPAQHFLVSPALYSGGWDVAGVSLTWTQGLRHYQSTYFISFRTFDEGGVWSEWTDFQVNTEFEVNSAHFNADVQRFFLPGASGHDSLQIRFVYNANFYYWGVDDVALVETEANNMRAQENFFAIAPWALVPENQLYPFGALIDIYNAGASPQTNVAVNHNVSNGGNTVYDATLNYGTIGPDSIAENQLFPELIELPAVPATYTATYTVSQDQDDFDPSDNSISFNYTVGGDVLGLEDGFTRSVAVANGIYDPGAPLSYAYGNYFYAVSQAKVENITWGVNNPLDMAGQTVQIYLLEWADTNGDQIAGASERIFIGIGDYTFVGDEGENVTLQTTLENFDDPGADIVLQPGRGYIAMIEYQASTADDPQFFMLASEARNYNAQLLAIDSAFADGTLDFHPYFSVLGFSPDGDIANIDYEVTELNVNDTRVFFGNDIVPLVRIDLEGIISVPTLPADQIITAYPNPANEFVNVKFDFTKAYDNVMINMVDNTGRSVYSKILNQLPTTHIERVNVSTLAPGSYHILISTKEGQRTVPVVVVK